MFPSSRRKTQPSAYEYNVQATEDAEESHDNGYPSQEKRRGPRGKRPNYKPTALTWPFIATQILVLAAVIGLIVWADKSMPDSDNTAIIDPVPSKAVPSRLLRADLGREFKRDNSSSVVVSTRLALDVQTSTGSDGTTAASMSATDFPDLSTTTYTGATSLNPAITSVGASRADEQDQITSPGTASSHASATSLTTPTSSNSVGSHSLSSGFKQASTIDEETTYSKTPTTSTGDSATVERTTTISTSQQTSKSNSIANSFGTTQTQSRPSSGPVSSSTQGGRNGKISVVVDPTATDSTTSFATSIITSKFTTTARSTVNLTKTLTIPEHTTTFNVTRSTVITGERTRTGNFTLRPSTIRISHTVTKTLSFTSVYSSTGYESQEPSTTVLVSEATSVIASFTVTAPTTVSSEVVEPTTITSVTVFPTTSEVPDTTSETVVQTYVPYLSTGQTVITSVATVVIQPPQTEAKTETPVVIVGTSVGGGQVHTVIETFAPQTRVIGDAGGLGTDVATPPPQTIVSQVGGSVVTNYIIITPTPTTLPVSLNVESTFGGESRTIVETQPPKTIVTAQDGGLVTLISTPPPQTRVTVVGGTLATVPVTSSAPGFQPISYVITTNSGGTLVTLTTATSPTATDPITLTFASTISGTPTTIIQTFPPTTFLTSLSGHLSTITTTPSPSTHLSTVPLTTATFTSTSDLPSRTGSSPPAQTSLVVTTKTYDLSSREYFTGTFLPPLLAVSAVIPLRIIDLNAKLYQPFNSLSAGASGYDALTLQFTGLMGFITPAATLMQGRPVPFITTLTVLCASLMVPLAAEAVSLKLHGRCNPLSSRGCAAALGVSPSSAHALLALAAAVAVLLCLLLFFLRDWTTGVHANPWNLAGIASLSRNPDVRIRAAAAQDDDTAVRRAVADKTYALGYYEAADGREEYGLLLADDSGRGLASGAAPDAEMHGDNNDDVPPPIYHGAGSGSSSSRGQAGRGASLPFMTLRYPWRVCFVLYLAGLLVLIAYYDYTLVAQVRDPTVPRYTSFHLSLDSHDFGIRFLFAGLGVIITFCWQAFFVAVATIMPFHALSRRVQPARRSVLVSRPTNAFSGLYLACAQRQPFYVAASAAAIASEFLPVLLSNVPHKLTQVLGPTLVCARVSLAVLAAMALVVGWSFFLVWPPIPVDPRCVAGMVWYVCESGRLLEDCEGLAEVDGRERERRVAELGRSYSYGEIGGGRMGVNVHLGLDDAVVTEYLPRGGVGAGREDVSGKRAMDHVREVGGAGSLRTGEDVVRAVLGSREDWEAGHLTHDRRR